MSRDSLGVSVNKPPTGVSKTVSLLEEGAYVLSPGDFSFSDPHDTPPNSFLALRIATLPSAGRLTLNGGGIVGGQFVSTADINAGKLIYQPALDGAGAGYASVTFQVRDSGGTTDGGVDLDPAPKTLTFNVRAVNDAPTGANKAIAILEDAAYTLSAGDFGFSDPDDNPRNSFLAIKFSAPPAAGSLTLNGVAVAAGQFVSTADINAGKLAFAPPSNGAGTAIASITFQVQDSGGTTNGGVDVDPTPKTLTFNATATNDAPTGANKTVGVLEDTAYVLSTGDFGFNDPTDSPANSFLAVRIATLPTTGALTLNGNAVLAGEFVTTTDINLGKLVYTPPANGAGLASGSLTFQVQDSGGTANGGIDLDPSPKTLTFNITPINDAPTGVSKVFPGLTISPYILSVGDFGFSDPDDTPRNSFLGVKIASLPTAGGLTLNGSAVAQGQVVTTADINAGKLVFAPSSNASGLASFAFQVKDSGGTFNGGIDLDPIPRTLTFNVPAVNHAPVGASRTANAREDEAYIFAISDFGFSDPNDNPASNFLAVKIASLPTAGTLTLNGGAATAGQFVSAADIGAGKLSFLAAPGASGANYASFAFQVQDDGGASNGGADVDPVAKTLTLYVASVNDAPSGANRSIGILEDTSYTLTAFDFAFGDPNDSPPDGFLAIRIASAPLSGSLLLNGAAVSPGQYVGIADINAGKLVFTPGANANGANVASFSFQVQDSGGSTDGGVDLDPFSKTISFNVSQVNDAPVGSSKIAAAIEDAPYILSVGDFSFSDPSDNPQNSFLAVRISSLPTTGTVMLNGTAVVAGQFVSTADINAGRLVFAPELNAAGLAQANLTFQIQDSGGTANGGVDLDPTPKMLTFNISPVNDSPAGVDKLVVASKDAAYVFLTTDFGFSDPKDNPQNSFVAVKIATLPTAGALTLNGAAVSAGQFVTTADINGGKLIFTPASGGVGDGYASLTFQVQDSGGLFAGGVDLDQTPNTMTFNVRDPFVIDFLPFTITIPGSYTVAGDLVTSGHGITILTSNVTIDLNGHAISGPNDPNNQFYGISSFNYDNITIRNGSIDGFFYGIYLSDLADLAQTAAQLNGGGHLIESMDISGGTFRGIRIEGQNNVIRNNFIHDIGGSTVYPNAFSFGIEALGLNALISGNVIRNIRGSGTEDTGEGVGISLTRFSDGSLITGNTIANDSNEVGPDYVNWPGQSRSSYGVWVGGDGSGDMHVIGNTIDNFIYGITFKRTVSGDFASNNVTHALVPYYLPFNDGLRVVDDGGNLSDMPSDYLALRRSVPGQTETVEIIYLPPLHRSNDFLYLPVHFLNTGDPLTGNESDSMADFWGAHAPVNLDLANATATTGNHSIMLVSIEGAQGSAFDDVLRGTSASNLFAGVEGNDTIYGAGGADYIFGDAGDDVVYPGVGSGRIDGGTGVNTVRYDDADYGSVTVSLLNPALNRGAAHGAVFLNIQALAGGVGNDILIGDNNSNILYGIDGNDRLFGNSGNDKLFGGAGHDMIYPGPGASEVDGGAGFNYVRYDDADYGNLTASLKNSSANSGAAQGDVYVNIQGLVGGLGNDWLYGDDNDNYIYAIAGNDHVFGGLGNDHLDGGAGNSTLTGGAGKDVFMYRAGYGNHTVADFEGGTGLWDQLDLTGLFASFSAVLASTRQVGADLVLDVSARTITLLNFYRGNFASDDVII